MRAHVVPTSVAAVLIVWTAVAIAAGEEDEHRYWALMRHGRQITGDVLRFEIDGRITLDDRELTDKQNPVRVLCDTVLASRLKVPFIELTNGDILPGRVESWVAADEAAATPECLLVVPTEPVQSRALRTARIRARVNAVERIVFCGPAGRRLSPGRIAFKNGRHATARSIRWSAHGIKALTKSGIVSAHFDELAEICLPGRDRMAGVLHDAILANNSTDDGIVRIRTVEGAQLTFPRAMVAGRQREPGTGFPFVQPGWAMNAITVISDRIVFHTYRQAGEIPLSLLPVDEVREKSGVHAWHWQRNRNVLGTKLHSGRMATDLGFGTHSYSEIAFDLPPGAKAFDTFVGLDRSVDDGGCVECKIFRDEITGSPLWKSGFLQGSREPVRVGSFGIAGAKRLVLVTDFGHKGRPAEADPFDIRDHVDWLLPQVNVNLGNAAPELAELIPALRGWDFSDAVRRRVRVRPFWNEHRRRWQWALVAKGSEPIEFFRKQRVTLTNAWLAIDASRDRDRDGHIISVDINGKKHETTMNGDLPTGSERPGLPGSRIWIFSDLPGKEVTITVVVKPTRGSDDPTGVLLDRVLIRPLVSGLPADGQPIKPEVLLTSLVPEAVSISRGERKEIEPGKLTDGRPLSILGWRFDTGFGVPTGSEITYKLDPSWRRFVALIGLADGWHAVGPYEILLDGQPHWQTKDPETFDRNSPGQQIDVEIPKGRKTITLRVHGDDSAGAWAAAGFLRESHRVAQ